MKPPGVGEVTRAVPSAAGRVVKFRARKTAASITTSHQHLSVTQERRGVKETGAGHAGRYLPRAPCRIVELGACENRTSALATGHEHSAAIQQSRGMPIARGDEAAGHLPFSSGASARL